MGIRNWKLEHAGGLYRDRSATLGKAAEEAGVSVREMMDYLYRNRIPMQYDTEDLEDDWEVIREEVSTTPERAEAATSA